MKRLNVAFVLTVLLVAVIVAAQAAEKTAASKTPQSLFQVKVSNGSLSLEARDAPLAKVFEEIGKQAGITVESNFDPAERVSMRFEKVPLEEGIKRLSNNVTIHYDKGHRITKIVVLAEDKRQITRSQDAKTAQPSKPRGPEPFKFEFDPAKAIKK
jgi:type II secretory pathway component GspD/PulD (secretin)